MACQWRWCFFIKSCLKHHAYCLLILFHTFDTGIGTHLTITRICSHVISASISAHDGINSCKAHCCYVSWPVENFALLGYPVTVNTCQLRPTCCLSVQGTSHLSSLTTQQSLPKVVRIFHNQGDRILGITYLTGIQVQGGINYTIKNELKDLEN